MEDPSAQLVQGQDEAASFVLAPYSTRAYTQHLRDLHTRLAYAKVQKNNEVLLLESASLQKTTPLSVFAGSASTSCNVTANRYKCPMWSGPKSAWKALYTNDLSMEKYTGGETLGPVEVGPVWARDERFEGVRACCF